MRICRRIQVRSWKYNQLELEYPRQSLGYKSNNITYWSFGAYIETCVYIGVIKTPPEI